MVPRDRKLGKWVSDQRTAYDKKKLLESRVQRLNSIGFAWKQYAPWINMYQRIISYKVDHNGSTSVPQYYDVDPQLGNWVNHQRRVFKKNKMPKERANLLKSIDFTWDAGMTRWMRNGKWMDMYQRLVSYKDEHNGSTLVPSKYKEDPKLGNWVSTQRYECKKKERVKLLNDINFLWKVRKNSP